MSNRITNAELKRVHSYMDEIDNEDFVTLLHKLLATFNFLVINGREWKEKSKKCSLLEVELIEKKQEILTLKNRIKIRDDRVRAINEDLQLEKQNSERYFNAYKTAIEREERLKARIRGLKRELNFRSYTKNEKE